MQTVTVIAVQAAPHCAIHGHGMSRPWVWKADEEDRGVIREFITFCTTHGLGLITSTKLDEY